jgi:uncharacterized tellurite resistance protein B-like protein
MLKKFFKKNANFESDNTSIDLVIKLMLEIALIDGHLDKRELDIINQKAQLMYNGEEEISQIINRIIEESNDSISFFDSVKEINETKSEEEKKELLKYSWKIVTADSEIDPYEENLYFRIAELIKIKRSIANKIRQENS